MLYDPKLQLFLEPDPHEFLCLLFFISNSQFSNPPAKQNCRSQISRFLNTFHSASISSNFGSIPEIAESLKISALKAARVIMAQYSKVQGSQLPLRALLFYEADSGLVLFRASPLPLGRGKRDSSDLASSLMWKA